MARRQTASCRSLPRAPPCGPAPAGRAELQQLLHRELAELVELAHRQEHVVGEAGDIQRAEHEGRLAQAAELLAEAGGVEGSLLGHAERHGALEGDAVVPGGARERERRPGDAAHDRIEPDAWCVGVLLDAGERGAGLA